MGLADRDYYQDERGPGIQLGPRTMVVNLMIINGVVFVANLLLGGPDNRIAELLSLHASDLAAPWFWWRFVTYGFVHNPDTASHIAINLFILWMFGRDVESLFGPRRIAGLYLVAVVLGGLIWATRIVAIGGDLERHALQGASGAVTAVMMSFVIHYPTRTILLFLVLPVPAWILGLLYVASDLSGLAARGAASVAYEVHLTGAALAVVFGRYGRWAGWSGGARRAGPFRNLFRRRPALRVREPESGDAAPSSGLDEQADLILAKVAQHGIDSLSDRERRILEAYSRRVKRKRR
ncbi:MAG: rhomboid family intramembrane serine protease [Planctomycetes bacterium]|nr:rhomboid family intramembrane serine protease [Planctomycetota bacterium]